jgi:acyl-CoA synthetase (AMP-forming)/AMP-acid ligase II
VTGPAYRFADQPFLSAALRDRVALRHRGVEVTFAELAERAGRYAGGVAASGLAPGEPVLVALPSSPHLFVVLIDSTRGCLAGDKRPTRVHVVDELPWDPSGKVVRRLVRERLAAGAEAGGER